MDLTIRNPKSLDNYFLNLPNEMILSILSYLDAKHLGIFSRVNTQTYSLIKYQAQYVWKECKDRDFIYININNNINDDTTKHTTNDTNLNNSTKANEDNEVIIEMSVEQQAYQNNRSLHTNINNSYDNNYDYYNEYSSNMKAWNKVLKEMNLITNLSLLSCIPLLIGLDLRRETPSVINVSDINISYIQKIDEILANFGRRIDTFLLLGIFMFRLVALPLDLSFSDIVFIYLLICHCINSLNHKVLGEGLPLLLYQIITCLYVSYITYGVSMLEERNIIFKMAVNTYIAFFAAINTISVDLVLGPSLHSLLPNHYTKGSITCCRYLYESYSQRFSPFFSTCNLTLPVIIGSYGLFGAFWPIRILLMVEGYVIGIIYYNSTSLNPLSIRQFITHTKDRQFLLNQVFKGRLFLFQLFSFDYFLLVILIRKYFTFLL
ncbi:hypothetical protein ABK040_003495 [Willaertia magna]